MLAKVYNSCIFECFKLVQACSASHKGTSRVDPCHASRTCSSDSNRPLRWTNSGSSGRPSSGMGSFFSGKPCIALGFLLRGYLVSQRKGQRSRRGHLDYPQSGLLHRKQHTCKRICRCQHNRTCWEMTL